MKNSLLHYESRHDALLPRHLYISRLLRSIFAGAFILSVSLAIGVVGYHATCGFTWIDSLLNASMILSGMGPTSLIETYSGKLFASLYALFSGVVFVGAIGIIIAPVAHRVFHKFHLEEEN